MTRSTPRRRRRKRAVSTRRRSAPPPMRPAPAAPPAASTSSTSRPSIRLETGSPSRERYPRHPAPAPAATPLEGPYRETAKASAEHATAAGEAVFGEPRPAADVRLVVRGAGERRPYAGRRPEGANRGCKRHPHWHEREDVLVPEDHT